MLVWMCSVFRDSLLGLLLLLAVSVVAREGLSGAVRRAIAVLKLLPGVERLIRAVVRRQVRSFLRQVERDGGRVHGQRKTMSIPEKGKRLTFLLYMVIPLSRKRGVGLVWLTTLYRTHQGRAAAGAEAEKETRERPSFWEDVCLCVHFRR